MALDLHLWANLNLVGNVSWSDYMSMTPEEAEAAYQALTEVVSKQSARNNSLQSFENLVNHYRNGGAK